MELIIIYIIEALAFLTIVYCLGMTFYIIKKQRKTIDQNRHLERVERAGAGDCHVQDGSGETIDITKENFFDKSGDKLNPHEYLKYVVAGDSMRHCGLNDGDLLFVKPGIDVAALEKSFVPIVVKKQNKLCEGLNFAVKQAWAACVGGNAGPTVEKVKAFPWFKPLLAYKILPMDSVPPNDAQQYGLIVSTVNPAEGTLRFSFQPMMRLEGTVKAAFPVPHHR